MRPRFMALLAAGLLGGSLGGCGGTGKRASSTQAGASTTTFTSSSTTAASASTPRQAAPAPLHPPVGLEADDDVARYGPPAPPAEERAAAALVKRYYHLLANGDGSAACSLMSPTFAHVVPNDYGRLGPSYLRGAKTCAAVLSRLARHERSLPVEVRQMVVVGVRVDGTRGVPLIEGPNMKASSVSILREGHAWRIGVLIGS